MSRVRVAGLVLCAAWCLLACQTPPPNTKDSGEIEVESKKEAHPRQAAAATKAFRRIPIPEYSSCGIARTQAIRSEADLADLLRVKRPGFGMEGFYALLGTTTIDFETETLLLLRHIAGGGGIDVGFDTPTLWNSLWGTPTVLTFRISAVSTGMAGIAATIHYCYAVIVDRSLADMIVLNVNDEAVFAMALDELSPYREEQHGGGE